MEKDDHIQDELKEQAPFLSGIRREGPFNVPANYFEELPTRVQDRVASRRSSQELPALEWLLQRRWASLSAAAVIAVCFSLALYFAPGNGPATPIAGATEVSGTGTVENTLSDNDILEYVDEEVLLEELALGGYTTPANNSASEQIHAEELELYLLEYTDEYEMLEL